MTTVTVPWGKEEISFELPSNWNVEGILSPPGIAALDDPAAEIFKAVARPEAPCL